MSTIIVVKWFKILYYVKGNRKKYTYETGRVVVTHSLGVTKSFKNGVSLHDLVLKGSLLLRVRVLLGGSTDGGEVRDYLLRVFSLSGTRLSAVSCK